MRLSTMEATTIKTVLASIDSTAKVYLFGSRVDDHQKGGDIDLLVFSKKIDLSKKIRFHAKLWEQLGEQKIDIVIAKASNHAFVDSILNKAVQL